MQVTAEQKTEWLTHYGLPNLFARPEVREFYKRLTNTPFQTGGIVVASLRVGQRIVATMWGPSNSATATVSYCRATTDIGRSFP